LSISRIRSDVGVGIIDGTGVGTS